MTESMPWKKDWISEVYFQAHKEVRLFNEYLSYDMSDLIGDVGGYLGLFLGWSLFGISVFIMNVVKKVFSKIKSSYS